MDENDCGDLTRLLSQYDFSNIITWKLLHHHPSLASPLHETELLVVYVIDQRWPNLLKIRATHSTLQMFESRNI